MLKIKVLKSKHAQISAGMLGMAEAIEDFYCVEFENIPSPIPGSSTPPRTIQIHMERDEFEILEDDKIPSLHKVCQHIRFVGTLSNMREKLTKLKNKNPDAYRVVGDWIIQEFKAKDPSRKISN